MSPPPVDPSHPTHLRRITRPAEARQAVKQLEEQYQAADNEAREKLGPWMPWIAPTGSFVKAREAVEAAKRTVATATRDDHFDGADVADVNGRIDEAAEALEKLGRDLKRRAEISKSIPRRRSR